MHAQVAGKEQGQNYQYDHAYAADGVEAPVLTVWPSWKTRHKRHDKNDRHNEHEHHGFAASLTVAVRHLSTSIGPGSAAVSIYPVQDGGGFFDS